MQKRLWTYYIYYSVDDLSVYGYTDDKSVANDFWMERNHSVFARKKVKLSSRDLDELHDEYGSARISIWELSGVPLALTHMEYMTVMQYATQLQITGVASCSVDPDVFTDSLRKSLDRLGYSKMHAMWKKGGYTDINISPLLVFLKLYNDTLNKSEGGGIFEIISLLLSGGGKDRTSIPNGSD